MFRPVMVAALAALMVSIAGCAEAPRQAVSPTPAASAGSTAAPAAPNAPAKVTIPPAKGENSLTAPGANSAVCQSDCDRRFRRCGDTGQTAAGVDQIQSLTAPRLFSPADDCRHQLDQCLARCSKVK